MKKMLIICAGLTFCCLALWGVFFARAGTFSPALTEDETKIAVKGPRYKLPAPPDLAMSALPAEAASPGPAGEEEPAGLLAVTFDDGPNINFTPLLLDGLRERGVHVTFFMLGKLVEKMPEIVLQAYEDGHAVGGHSYDHRSYLTKLSAQALQTQLQKTDDAFNGITGAEPPLLLRPPYGAINEEVAQRTGKANILWNIDPRDWEVRDAAHIYNFIMERAVPGGVIILHDIYETSVEGALQAIDALLAEGWLLVTIPELYAAYDIPLQAGGIYRSPGVYTLPEED